MDSSHTMIVRGQTLPVPPEAVQRFFGGDDPAAGRRLVVRELNRGFALDGATPFLTIGRSDDCDVTLDHADVSYRHAHLQLVRGNVYCIDLASRTGTFWGEKKRPAGWLLPGQPVTIGPYTIAVADDASAGESRQLASLDLLSREVFEHVSGFGYDLVFLNGRHRERHEQMWPIQQPITLVGSSRKCRLRLNDDSVSRAHCTLMASPAGLWVTDLLGRDGTHVNGRPVTFQLLRDRDELGVGRFRFEVRYRRPPVEESTGRTNPTRERGTDSEPFSDASGDSKGGGGVSEQFVLSMMDRFSAMQQQMSAINQQQMMFMGQLVGMMHQNHHELVQREMARVAEISEQIERLQAAVAAGDANAAPQLSSHGKHIEGGPAAIAAADDVAAPLQPAAPLPSLDGAAEASPESLAADPPRPRHTHSDVASHTTLIERMAALEKERNSRWKKIMRLLTGASP